MNKIEDNILIIIPTLNSYKLLPKLVNSIYGQTFKFWKILFIDGNSESNHINWLKECCIKDSRCSWIKQKDKYSGIFGAMNQGFSLAHSNEWILFWGSDDWASSSKTFEDLMKIIKEGRKYNNEYDLICCKGSYINNKTKKITRSTSFINKENLIDSKTFKKCLFRGLTPPHQSTLIGPKAREKISLYNEDFKLSADLNYFLELSLYKNLKVKTTPKEIVFMGDEGISGKMTFRRLYEVFRAYKNSFQNLWIIPFMLRYIKKIFLKLNIK